MHDFDVTANHYMGAETTRVTAADESEAIARAATRFKFYRENPMLKPGFVGLTAVRVQSTLPGQIDMFSEALPA